MIVQETKTKQEKSVKPWLKEWWDALVFAVVVATLFRWAFVEPYKIPTPSMERSLLVGDFLFVSKMHYGTRTPITALQLPLTHQTIWGTEIPSYLTWIKLPFFRLPGFTSIKNNDPVVFNYPPEIDRPIDQRTHYIKRCIGIAGDTVELRDKVVYVNGRALPIVGEQQSSYLVQSETELNKRFFQKREISEVYPTKYGYLIQTSEEKAGAIKPLEFIGAVHEITHDNPVRTSAYPHDDQFPWTTDFYGPLYIPKEGDSIKIDEKNLILYGDIIKNYEHNDEVVISDNKLMIEGHEIKDYTFKQDYYFMLGDNRHNSEDSRFWGLVPEDHIVGKALFVWFSIDSEGGFFEIFQRVRWKRILHWID